VTSCHHVRRLSSPRPARSWEALRTRRRSSACPQPYQRCAKTSAATTALTRGRSRALRRYAGLDCHLILRTSRALTDGDPGLVGNLLVERMVGAHLHLVRTPGAPAPRAARTPHRRPARLPRQSVALAVAVRAAATATA